MIYDPITRQVVTIVGKYPPQDHMFSFGSEVKGDFRFVRLIYGDHLPGFSGGLENGTQRDVDVNALFADGGLSEILTAYQDATEIRGPS